MVEGRGGWRGGGGTERRMEEREEQRKKLNDLMSNLLNANSQLLPVHVFNLSILKYGPVQMYLIS